MFLQVWFHGKFMLWKWFLTFQWNTFHFSSKIPFTSNSRYFSEFKWNHSKIYNFFTQNHEKLGKLCIDGVYSSTIWWNMKSCSCSNQVNFDHVPNLSNPKTWPEPKEIFKNLMNPDPKLIKPAKSQWPKYNPNSRNLFFKKTSNTWNSWWIFWILVISTQLTPRNPWNSWKTF